MNAKRISEEYENVVGDFIEFAKMSAPSKNEKYFCLYVKCLNKS